MELKWLFEPLLLVSVDFLLGSISFCCQIAFFSTYLIATNYDLAGTGIWAGIIFIATAAVTWKMDGKINKFVLGIGPCLSFACGVILFSLNVASLSQLTKMCPLAAPIGNAKYHCSAEIGLDVVLMLCGLFAIPVNAILILFLLNLVKSN
ncbi:uncharacterized protein LOC130685735 [Daphnia carinata]|uniref:uncharacterized protein LOC130685735 n=1 Tax=Daphnia carinata TaxID=120202 RepID=UPI00257BFD09|nr:uncharacterized protein LOC130685735 [Daphnia carinata]